MRRALLSVAVALVLVSCERQEPQDVVTYALCPVRRFRLSQSVMFLMDHCVQWNISMSMTKKEI